jgi:hypothetical protein
MSEISKQALKVDNSTSFPNNTTGYISPTILRAFNVNMIDSLVEQEGYNEDSASWNISIGQLNTYTASFAPSLSSLNAFTASQLVVNSNLNVFTQSANASINRLDSFSSSFNAYTSSINQIRSNGVVLGTSTIFNLVGPGTFFSASLVQNIQGNIATLTFTSDNAKLNTSSFNDYTQSVNQVLNSLTSGSNSYTASNDQKVNSLIARTGSYATTGSNTFVDTQTINTTSGQAIIASGSITLSPGSFVSASVIRPTSAIEMQPQTYFRFITGSTYFNMQLNPGTGDWSWSRSGISNVKVLELAGEASATSSFANNSVRFLDTVPNVIFDTPVRILKGIGTSIQVTGSLQLSDRILVTNGGAEITGALNLSGSQTIRGAGGGNNQNVLSYNGYSVNTTDNPAGGAEQNLLASTASAATTLLGIYDNPNFNVDVELQTKVNSTGITFSDWDNGSVFDYIPYMTIAPNVGDNPTPVFTRGLNVTGSTTITGSVYGNIASLTISSNTASMDLSRSNFFTLNLVSGSTTHLTATNIRPGQTINLLLTQPSVGTGSLSYNTTFDFPAGANYIATPITSSKDIITFITFDTASIYATSINNLG